MNIIKDRNKELEIEIEQYLNCLQKGVLTFYLGVKDYMANNTEQFESRIIEVSEHENDADDHLKNLKFILFRYNLVPDISADIMELMDAMDDLSDISKEVLLGLQVEKPVIDNELKEDFIMIAKNSKKAAETLIKAVRIYFTHFNSIEDYISKVYYYESEVDKLFHKLRVKLFANDIDRSTYDLFHQRYFAQEMALLSDIAEEMASKLSVFRFKRGI